MDGFYVGLTAAQKAVAAKCSPLEREFVMRWIAYGCDPTHAAQALKEALGNAYKPGTTAAALQRRVNRIQLKQTVNDFIDIVRQHSIHTAIMEKEEAQLRLSFKARTSMDDVLEWSEYIAGHDDDGNPIYQTAWRLKNLNEMPPHVQASIKSVSVDASGRPKIELYDSIAALRLLADIKGWKAPDKKELTGPDGQPLAFDPHKIDEPTLKALLEQSTKKILDAL